MTVHRSAPRRGQALRHERAAGGSDVRRPRHSLNCRAAAHYPTVPRWGPPSRGAQRHDGWVGFSQLGAVDLGETCTQARSRRRGTRVGRLGWHPNQTSTTQGGCV